MSDEVDPSRSPLTVVVHSASGAEYVELISRRFPELHVTVADSDEELLLRISDADVLLGASFPSEAVERASRLKWFQATAAGVSSIVPIAAKLQDIKVTNAKGIHGDIIADLVMAGTTILHWDMRGIMRDQSARVWKQRYVSPLSELSMGIIGLGAVGAAIARRAKSAGMSVFGTKRNSGQTVEGVDRVYGADQLEHMIPQCDFLVLALPETTDTIGLIGGRELDLMRPSAYLINVARGSVVVERDLISALQSGRIAGAFLDVFETEPLPTDNPLWDMPNVIVTPHSAGAPANYAERVFEIFAENVERFRSGKPLRNEVDLSQGY